MEHYAGIDVSLELSSVCVVDATGRMVREAKVASEPEALIGWLRGLGFELARVGLEAGPLSQWLYAAMRDAGLPIELLETRHVRDAFKAMPVKTDRNDARGIAQLLRLGWFRPVHCKSVSAQETRALLTARKLLNRPGFAGGQFAWVTPPWRGPQAEHSSAPRPRQAGCCRSAREDGGFFTRPPPPKGGNPRVSFLGLGPPRGAPPVFKRPWFLAP